MKLTKNFKLKIKNLLFLLSALLVSGLLITGYMYFFPAKAGAAWFDESWLYRQKVNITNSSTAQTDFQVQITLDTQTLEDAGKIQTDCDDLRITDANGNILPHWIEPTTCSTSATKIWTKVPSIPADSTAAATLYLYYGNSSASSGASATNKVFIREISSLKAAWAMDENVSGNGQTIADSSGSSNTGTTNDGANDTGMDCTVDGKFGKGCNLDGTDDRITVTDNASLDLQAGDFSVAGWINMTAIPSQSYGMVFLNGVDANNGLAVGYSNHQDASYKGMFMKVTSTGTKRYVLVPLATFTPSTSTWYHVAWVWNSSTLTGSIYVNGTYRTTNTTAEDVVGVESTYGPVIGARSVSEMFFNGKIDDLKVYNKTLSATEISDLYGTGGDKQGYTTTNYTGYELVRKYSASVSVGSPGSEEKGKGPVGYWSFDDGQGTTAQDSSSSNNDGTISGASWQPEDRCVSGKCLYFDGSTSKVTGSKIAYGVQSVSFWIRPNTIATQGILDLDGGTHKISTDASGVISATGFSSPTYYINGIATATPTLTLNKWNHVVITTATGFNSTNAFTIGTDGTNYIKGFMDDVKFYPYARSAAQVKTDYQSGAKNAGTNSGTSAVLGSSAQDYLSNGLVGYWKMDETSGNLTDSSGNGKTGTVTGTTVAAGKFGNGRTFDSAASDFAQVTTGSIYDLNDTYTVALWMKYTVNGNYIILNKRDSGTLIGFSFETDANGIPAIASRDASSNLSKSAATQSYNDGNWHHFVGTFDRNKNTVLYVDGVAVTTTASATTGSILTNSDIFIGRRADTSAAFFPGSLDETRIYNRALSPKEVSDLYNWAPGPVAHWDFEEGKDNTCSGGSNDVCDTSGNAVDGAWNGTGAHWSSGKVGKAGKFNGSDDYVQIADNVLLEPTNITIEAWIYPRSFVNQVQIVHHYDGDITKGYNLQIRDTGKLSWFVANSCELTPAYTIKLNRWTHIVATFDDDNNILRAYADGVRIVNNTNCTVSIGNPNATIRIGVSTHAFVQFFDGLIDDVRIYNYVRTQKQIVEDMQGGNPSAGSGPRSGAIAHYRFDEGYGTSANDSTPNANTLTLSSASWTDSGKFGKAWNGTNAVWLSRADDSDFDVTDTDDYAISLWFKSDSADNPGAVEYLFNKASAVIAGYAVYANTDGTVCFGIDDDTTWGPDVSSCTSSDIYDGAWHHLIAVRDTVADKTLIYTDGVLRDSDTDSTTATLVNSLSLYLGDRDGTNNGDEFTGDLDEVKVYRYALNSDDVKVEYNRGSSMVLGTLSDNASYAAGAANQEYCVPGDSTSCAAPIARWDFEEGRDNTCSGGSNDVCDISGNGNDGAWSGTGSRWTTGKAGKAGKFNGSDDTINVGDPADGDLDMGTSDFTIEAWVLASNLSSRPTIVQKIDNVGMPADPARNGYSFMIDSNSIDLKLYGNNSATHKASSATTFSSNTWYFVAATADRDGNVTFYKNGGSIGTADISAFNVDISNSDNFTIGSNIINGFINGRLDNIRIFKYVRTPAQIAWDYNRGAPVGHWKLDECQGTTAYDSSGNNNSGTITIGGTGTQTTGGTCTTPTDGTGAWYNGATGKRNASLKFDGTDDKITIGTAITGVQSVSFWVKPTTSTDSFIDLDGGTHYITSSSGTVSATGFTTPTIYVNGVAGGTLTGAAWNHVVVTTGTSFNTTTSMTFGYKSAATADYLTGQIDDVKIWNYALTAAQIKNEYNGGAVNFGPVTGSP